MVNTNGFGAILTVLFLFFGAAKFPAAIAEPEPDPKSVRVKFDVQLAPGEAGTFAIEVHPSWAPLGAARFLELVDLGESFWKGVRFFRVISGFMAQFGIPGKPDLAAEWRERTIQDDPKLGVSNARGYVSFATSGENSRTTQIFINFGNNANLDSMGFTPFGRVVGEGMDVVDRLYAGYGEGAPGGNGPEQGRIQSEGNRYLKRSFPKLSYITSVSRVMNENEEEL